MDGQQMLGGRYRVGQVLGRGGMATVHAGHDETLGRDVAIKIFRPDVGDAGEHDRQVAEVRVLAKLSHPNLVTLYDAHLPTVNDFSDAYIVMELVTGPTLSQLIAEGRLTPQRTAEIGSDIARGLAAAHAAGVVHSDVKPANVLLTPSGTPKLADFGIASLVGAAQLTGTGQTLGTPAYLSPEQVTAAPVTGASDIYSLGLVLLECLTGQRAYPGTGMQVALARLGTQPTIPANLPAGWAPLLARMTDREPSRRPSPTEVAQVMDGLAAGAADPTEVLRPVVAGPPTERLSIPAILPPVAAVAAPLAATRVEPERRDNTALIIALFLGFVIVVVAIGAGVYLLTKGNGSSSTTTPTTSPTVTFSASPTPTTASPTATTPSATPSRSPTPSQSPTPSRAPSSVAPTTRAATTAPATTAPAPTTPVATTVAVVISPT